MKGGEHPASTFLWEFAVPFRRQGADNTTLLDRAILNWNAHNPDGVAGFENGYYPDPPDPFFRREGVKINMTPEEYHDFVRDSGQKAYQRLLEQAEAEQWDAQAPTPEMMESIKLEIRLSRREVREDMIFDGSFSNMPLQLDSGIGL